MNNSSFQVFPKTHLWSPLNDTSLTKVCHGYVKDPLTDVQETMVNTPREKGDRGLEPETSATAKPSDLIHPPRSSPNSSIHPPSQFNDKYSTFSGSQKASADSSYDQMVQPLRKLKPMKMQFFKTKLCPWILSNGFCRKAGSCRYAHSSDEIRPLPDLRRTKFCPKALQEGECRDKASCKYAHSYEELRATQTFVKIKLCPLWLVNSCTKSSHVCRFAHGETDLRGVIDRVHPKPNAGTAPNSSMLKGHGTNNASMSPWFLLSNQLKTMLLNTELNDSVLESSYSSSLPLTSPDLLGKTYAINGCVSPRTTAETFAVSRQSSRLDLRENLSDTSQSKKEAWCFAGRHDPHMVKEPGHYLTALESEARSTEFWNACGELNDKTRPSTRPEHHADQEDVSRSCQKTGEHGLSSKGVDEKAKSTDSWSTSLGRNAILSPKPQKTLQTQNHFQLDQSGGCSVPGFNGVSKKTPWSSPGCSHSVHSCSFHSNPLREKTPESLPSSFHDYSLATGSTSNDETSFFSTSQPFSQDTFVTQKSSMRPFFNCETQNAGDAKSHERFSPFTGLASSQMDHPTTCQSRKSDITANLYTGSECEFNTRGSPHRASTGFSWERGLCVNQDSRNDAQLTVHPTSDPSLDFPRFSTTRGEHIHPHTLHPTYPNATTNATPINPLNSEYSMTHSRLWRTTTTQGLQKLVSSSTQDKKDSQETGLDTCPCSGSPRNPFEEGQKKSLSLLLRDEKNFMAGGCNGGASSPTVSLDMGRSYPDVTSTTETCIRPACVFPKKTIVDKPFFQNNVISPSQVYPLPCHRVQNEKASKYTQQENPPGLSPQAAFLAPSPLTVPFVYSLDVPFNPVKKSPITTVTSGCKSPSSLLFPGFPIVPLDCSYADDVDHSFPTSGGGSDYFTQTQPFQYNSLNSPSAPRSVTCYKDSCQTPSLTLPTKNTQKNQKLDPPKSLYGNKDLKRTSLVKDSEELTGFSSSTTNYVVSSPETEKKLLRDEMFGLGHPADHSETTASTVESHWLAQNVLSPPTAFTYHPAHLFLDQTRRKFNTTRYSDPE